MKYRISYLLPFLFVCFLLATSCKDDEKVEICNNGVDDDGNGFTDCEDVACICEICDNNIDDDNDGFIDCDDNDCNAAANCTNLGSDLRLKSKVKPLLYGLDELLQLNTKQYEYTAEKGITRLGLVAQDAEKIIPEIVSTNDGNQMLQIRYIDLVAVLINATQQQQALIEENRQLIQSLKELQEQQACL